VARAEVVARRNPGDTNEQQETTIPFALLLPVSVLTAVRLHLQVTLAWFFVLSGAEPAVQQPSHHWHDDKGHQGQ
jgi:hypothetical protein